MRLNSALKKIGSALAIGVLVLFPCHPTWALENPFKPVCDRSIEIRNYFEKSLGKKCSEIKASNLKWDFKQETLLITEVETIRTGDLSGIEASSIEIRSSKLREIEADSFHGSSIQNLIISNSAPTMKTINNKALRGLECFSFYINNTSIETIKNETFGVELLGYNKSIASIQIKNNINLKTIEDGAFGVKPIGQIHLANNPLWKLQKNLFNNVGPIGSIIIENNSNILEIEPGTFKGSISAVKLNGNKSLKILRKGTFQPTTDLSIGIDNNVEIIEPGAFKGDESVKIFLYIHSSGMGKTKRG